MNLEKKAKITGAVASFIFNTLLILLLLFLTLSKAEVQKEQGVPVSLGMPDAGGDDLFEPTPESEVPEVAEQAPTAPSTPAEVAPPAPAEAVAPKVETQNLEETAEVPTAKKKTEKPSTMPNAAEEEARKLKELARQEELKRQKEQAAELARIKAEEEARKKAEAEALAKKKAEQEAARQKAASLANNAFKKNTSATGNGTDANSNGAGSGTKPGNNGSPDGSAGGGKGGHGNVWSLAGRNIVGTVPKPSYADNEEGYVIVNITVDRDGNVVAAELGKVFGITSPSLRQAALNAAKKAKFTSKSDAPMKQHGTIRFDFKLR